MEVIRVDEQHIGKYEDAGRICMRTLNSSEGKHSYAFLHFCSLTSADSDLVADYVIKEIREMPSSRIAERYSVISGDNYQFNSQSLYEIYAATIIAHMIGDDSMIAATKEIRAGEKPFAEACGIFDRSYAVDPWYEEGPSFVSIVLDAGKPVPQLVSLFSRSNAVAYKSNSAAGDTRSFVNVMFTSRDDHDFILRKILSDDELISKLAGAARDVRDILAIFNRI